MAFTEDLSAFIGPDTPGSNTATLSGQAFPVLFDGPYQSAMAGLVETSAPQITCKSADVASAVQGTPITVGTTAYKVATVQPDGTGITTLVLELA